MSVVNIVKSHDINFQSVTRLLERKKKSAGQKNLGTLKKNKNKLKL